MDLKNIITKDELNEPYIFLADFLELDQIVEVEQLFQGKNPWFNKDYKDTLKKYPKLVELLGNEKAVRAAKVLSKDNYYFSSIKRNCYDKIVESINIEYNGYNVSELAQKYGYCERQIYNILRNGGRKKESQVYDGQICLNDFIKETQC